MSFISDIFAGGTEGVLKGVRDVISTVKADPLEIAKLDVEMKKLQATLDLGLSQAQTKVNEVEAASTDKFTSRWRPAIGWICGAAYAYEFLIYPFMSFVAAVAGHPINHTDIPQIDVGELSMVLMGMLGLGAMRSWDKSQK